MMELTYPAMAEIMSHQLLKIKKISRACDVVELTAGEIWKEASILSNFIQVCINSLSGNAGKM